MKLSQAFSKYLSYQRSMGLIFDTVEAHLKSFMKKMGDVDLEEINQDAIWKTIAGGVPLNGTIKGKLSALRGFYRFLLARGYAAASPLPISVRKGAPTRFRPYIYTKDELRRLFAGASAVEKDWDPLRAPTIRTIMVLLYAAGLRLGEAVNLCISEVDLCENVIVIQQAKFSKTRQVPISKELSQVMADYHSTRIKWSPPEGEDSPFFVTCKRKYPHNGYFRDLFYSARKKAGLDIRGECGFKPRLHDLRHTFAVHRLISWYQEGKDVHTLLPYLSVYLGHLNLSGTQPYLSMTPELLSAANQRFEKYSKEMKNE